MPIGPLITNKRKILFSLLNQRPILTRKISRYFSSFMAPTSTTWIQPAQESSNSSEFQIYNTLTKTKVPFIPSSPSGRVTWYSCGPTVYDAAHIGHARNYVTFDIIRRVFQNYFGYEVFYVMNITDVDDKIILRARQGHLVKQFFLEHPQMNSVLRAKLEGFLTKYSNSKLGIDLASPIGAENLEKIQAKLKGLTDEDAKIKMYCNNVVKAINSLQTCSDNSSSSELVGSFEDIIAADLDELYGASVTDHKIYRELSLFWENDFLQDMKSLNVLPPDVKTRVSEFIPEIISFCEKVIKNGYAYVAEGSVYFDVEAFSGHNEHSYAKLCPTHAGNAKFFEEGEGSLGIKLCGKKDPKDFALWKCSKPGEPFWASPWGNGRPGWHIECSAMASSVVPGTLDIHSGGIDLAFPHHDNEIAQCEAFYECSQWVNYFLHAGHVHIEGHKMSKSLKNFITIKEALKRNTASQLRIMFLQHHWKEPLTFKESSLSAAVSAEQTIVHFFAAVSALTRQDDSSSSESNWHAPELELAQKLEQSQNSIDVALRDSIDTPTAFSILMELVSATNIYIAGKHGSINRYIIIKVARYITKMLRIFGVAQEGSYDQIGLQATSSESGVSDKESLVNCAESVSKFRDAVRAETLKLESGAIKSTLLSACDNIRKELLNLGISIEDRQAPTPSIVKILSPEQLEQYRQEEERLLQEKLERMALNEAKNAAKLAKAKVSPKEMFLGASDKYSKFDENGVPTHEVSGEELSKNARKKCLKEYEQQSELHEKYLNGKL
jgi:cysteinyl-tRNA synthetase